MMFSKIQKLDMFMELFQKNRLPPIYGSMSYSDHCCLGSLKKVDKGPYSIRFIPEYMGLSLSDPMQYSTIKIGQFYPGCAISLNSISSPEAHVKARFGRNSRKIHRFVSHLETCFDITYKMYWGAMSYDTYCTVMNALKAMLDKRFRELNDTHQELVHWGEIFEQTYPGIVAKKASLFVVYNKKTPIVVSLNYHFDKILYSAIPSFDTDYSKFGLGHVEIYKQIEWCLANDIQIFEMGEGDLDYKRRWSNTTYCFEHHIIYRNNSVLQKTIAYIELLRVKARTYLNSKNIQIQGYRLVTYKPKRKKPATSLSGTIEYITDPIDHWDDIPLIFKVDYNKVPFRFLKRIVFDHLYAHSEHSDDVELFEIEKGKCYVIKGKKGAYKITLKL